MFICVHLWLHFMPSIYDYPEAYDAIMRASTNQLDLEIDAVHTLLINRGKTSARILELGCGTCPHGIPLSQRGHHITGVDISQPMVAYVQTTTQTMGLAIESTCANIRDFHLPADPFDCAIFMSETFPLLTEYDDIANHFRAVQRHLKPEGLYVIDIGVLRQGYYNQQRTWGHRALSVPNGQIAFWYEDHPADWERGVNRLTMHAQIHADGREIQTADPWEIRLYSPWTLTLLMRALPNWTLLGFFSYRDLSPNIANDDNYFMLLQKC